jgi:hypothetical protein
MCQPLIDEIDKYIIAKVTPIKAYKDTLSQKLPSHSFNLLSKPFIVFSMCVMSVVLLIVTLL